MLSFLRKQKFIFIVRLINFEVKISISNLKQNTKKTNKFIEISAFAGMTKN